MTGRVRRAGVAAFLLLAGCGSGGDNEAGAKPADPPRASGAASAAPDTDGTRVAPVEPDAATTPSGPDIAFDGEGLRLVTATGSTRALPFGMARQDVLAPLERFRGPADGGTNTECGAGPIEYAVWADGLTMNFQEGRFVGWALDRRGEGAHSTMSGIGPGSTRRDLEAAYDIEVRQTTLGTEFSAGGMGGLLDGDGAAARVTDLWAGVICAFR